MARRQQPDRGESHQPENDFQAECWRRTGLSHAHRESEAGHEFVSPPPGYRQHERAARWHPLEIIFGWWLSAAICCCRRAYLILTEIAWLGLFARSLDLIVGYAASILARPRRVFRRRRLCGGAARQARIDQRTGIRFLVAGLAAMAAGFRHQLPRLRGSDLTRLMVSLGVALMLRETSPTSRLADRRRRRLQGVTHAADPLGCSASDMFGHNASS